MKTSHRNTHCISVHGTRLCEILRKYELTQEFFLLILKTNLFDFMEKIVKVYLTRYALNEFNSTND